MFKIGDGQQTGQRQKLGHNAIKPWFLR